MSRPLFWTAFFMSKISEKYPELTAKDFSSVCELVQKLPYKRNADKTDPFCVIKDSGGTCSAKHAFLKRLADEMEIENVKLMLGVFMMNAQNTRKISPVLEKYGLKEMPEAHNYLRINGEISDFTRKGSAAENFVNDLAEEIEIQPEQITDFKVEFHQDFLKNYLLERPEIQYTLEDFWKIREECISVLQK